MRRVGRKNTEDASGFPCFTYTIVNFPGNNCTVHWGRQVALRDEGPIEGGQQHPAVALMDNDGKALVVILRVMATFQGP